MKIAAFFGVGGFWRIWKLLRFKVYGITSRKRPRKDQTLNFLDRTSTIASNKWKLLLYVHKTTIVRRLRYCDHSIVFVCLGRPALPDFFGNQARPRHARSRPLALSNANMIQARCLQRSSSRLMNAHIQLITPSISGRNVTPSHISSSLLRS